MTTLYLITGFLGAGKTNFLHRFLKQFKNNSIRVIVNEFGKTGVDGMLLKSLGVISDEISGGSIFCTCRSDQFEKALDIAVITSPDYIIVEASGLSDPTGIHKVIADSECIQFGGCICLVDAVNLPKVYETARVCKKQLSVCDVVILNKIDIAAPEQLNITRSIIKMQCPDVPVTETSYGYIPDRWIETLHRKDNNDEGNIHTMDINLHSVQIKISEQMSMYDLTKFIEAFAEDTYRIKGFIRLNEIAYYVDCIGNLVQVKPNTEFTDVDNILTVLYGYGLQAKKSIKKAVEWYPEMILEIE